MRSLHVALLALAVALPAAAFAEDNAPPKIVHTPVTSASPGVALKITADIVDESGIFEPKLHYRAAGSPKYLTTSMVLESGSTYAGTITDTVLSGDVEYFLEAYDTLGNGPALFASEAAPQRIRVVAAPPVARLPEIAPPPTSDPNKVPSSAVAGTAPSGSGTGMKVAAYSLIGVGVVGVVVGAVLGASVNTIAKEAQDEPTAKGAHAKEDSAKANTLGANVAYVAGGVLAATGVVLAVLPLFHSSPSGADKAIDARLFVAPTGVGVAGTF